MEKLIDEMDGLFKQVVKYYPMKDLAETKRQWNSLVSEFKNCNLACVSNSVCPHCNSINTIEAANRVCLDCNETFNCGQNDW